MSEKVYGYSLRDKKGRRVYTGTTNNPRERRLEHRGAGKKFAKFRIETGPMSRADADAWERASLKGYRNAVGKNPVYNKTLDGQWKPGTIINSTRRRVKAPKSKSSRPIRSRGLGRRRNRPF